MYIYPNMELKILKNVRLTNDYDHTIDFGSANAQSTYFISKAKFTLYNQQYQRKERGWIQVDLNQNDLWDCTYLMYKNTSYINKWFYAFILNIEYINDKVSRIHYEIDVMQTWAFDYQLEECFVVREHTITDSLFQNLVPENLDIGDDYITDEYASYLPYTYWFNSSGVYIYATRSAPSSPSINNMGVRKGVFSGLTYYYFDITSSSEQASLKAILEDYINNGQEDNIVQIIQAPKLIGSPDAPVDPSTGCGGGYYKENLQLNLLGCFQSITQKGQTYTPKNKKLFSYPYYFIHVSDKEGNDQTVKFELFNYNRMGSFLFEATAVGKASVTLTPMYYRGLLYDRDSSLVYDNFPQCQWRGDSYQIWMAQNGPRMNVRMAKDIWNIGKAFTSKDNIVSIPGMPKFSATITMANRIQSAKESFDDNFMWDKAYIKAQILSASRLPNRMHGEFTNGIINIQNETSGFEFKIQTPRLDYIKRIDQYFSVYGYACNEVKIPNKLVRQNWSYTKTLGCEIAPLNGHGVPGDDAQTIRNIYDKGITFWRNGDNIGNYGDFTNGLIG